MGGLTPDLGVGERIRVYRLRRGMSQAVLGGLVGRSEDWVSKVERGIIPIDRLSVLIEVAHQLRVRDLSELTGRAVVAMTPDESPEHEAVPAIRRALHTPPSRLGADLPGDALTVDEMAERVGEAWRIYEHETMRYAAVGSMLPRLLGEAYQAAAATNGAPRVVRQLVALYHLMQVFLRRVGERTLSQIAADRAMALADQTDDPVLVAASAWNMCSILTNTGHVEESAELALSTIERYPLQDEASPEQVSVLGALHLAAVIASARAGRAPAAWDLLGQAEAVSQRTAQDRNDWRTSFGPTNVAMHGVHLAAEEGDASEALRLADRVEDNPELPLERRTRYFIEVMHAHRLKRDDMGTLWMAQKIRAISPEEMRWHPLVRDAVAELLKRERPRYRQEVRDLASHVGVLT